MAVCEAGVQASVPARGWRCDSTALTPPDHRRHIGLDADEPEQASPHGPDRRPTVKLALDPQMFSTSSVHELPDIVAGLGYEWMELSPKADFTRSSGTQDRRRRGGKLKKIASDAGVGIAVLPVLRWSGPDEDQRQAVRAWKRVIQITVDLGVEVSTPSSAAGQRHPRQPRPNSSSRWTSCCRSSSVRACS